MRRRPLVAPLLAVAVLGIAGCTSRPDPCAPDQLKADVASLAWAWYLYPNLLPQTLDLGAYPGPGELLDAMTATARSQGKDRHWSYVTSASSQQAFFADGTFVGFGLNLLTRTDPGGTTPTHLYASQVYAGSAAAAAGFLRGDEIVAIGTADPLTPVTTLLADATGKALSDALGPATAGITLTFSVIPRGGTTPGAPRTMTKGTYSLDPVPAAGVVVIPRTGLPPAGYVALRSFISPANAPLASAFATFQSLGVTDVVVDLRYNGGGLLSTAEELANLLGAGLANDVMYNLSFNPRESPNNLVATFSPIAGAITPAHVAFLVTGASASASELVPNALAPWRPIALVGHQTYGKPVGQLQFVNSQCDVSVALIGFQLTNKDGFGGYFSGLPATGFAGCGIPADDDLQHETWDPAETQTAAALAWLANQSSASPAACAPPPSPMAPSRAPGAPDAYPEAARPTDAQRHSAGLF